MCEQTNSSNDVKTLASYILDQKQFHFYSGIIERFFLASEIINECDDEIKSADNKFKLSLNIPFLNPSNITIRKATDDTVPQFQASLPTVTCGKNRFENYAYCDPQVLFTKGILSTKWHESSDNEVCYKYYDHDERYMVQTLARILFEVCFCCHPYKGRAYYANAIDNSEDDRLFFCEQHKFIFDLNDNPNRFIVGFHSQAWDLWTASTKNQKELWEALFVSGSVLTFHDFKELWHKSYESNWYNRADKLEEPWLFARTPCGEKLLSMIFDDELALIVSDNGIGINRIKCYGCIGSKRDKCSNCSFPGNTQYARVLMKSIDLIKRYTVSLDNDVQETRERKNCIKVFEGRKISKRDYAAETSNDSLFEVVASKKSDLLGLKCIIDVPISARQGTVSRTYKLGDTIALLPGTQISVPGGFEIFVPSVQVGTPANGITTDQQSEDKSTSLSEVTSNNHDSPNQLQENHSDTTNQLVSNDSVTTQS